MTTRSYIQGVQHAWALDVRALAVFRVSLGLIVLADLCVRATDITAFYTDFGVLPRGEHIQAYYGPSAISPYLANGSWLFIACLFVIHAMFAASFTVGFRTRLSQVVMWVLLLGLHRRNPMVLQGGDVMLRLLLFWSLFLPLGATWSVDAAIRGASNRVGRVFNVGALGLLVQLVVIYGYGLVLKSGAPWRDGTAVHYALHIDHFATSLGAWIRQFEGLTQLFTYSTLVAEFMGPALLILAGFLPGKANLLRCLAVLIMVLLHVGFGLGLNLGLFSVIAVAAWCVWLPACVWNRLERCMPGASDFASARSKSKNRLGTVVGAALLVYAVVWNNFSIASPPTVVVGSTEVELKLPASSRWLGELIGIDQQWDMFSPMPFVNDGWFLIAGVTSEGHIDFLWPHKTEIQSNSADMSPDGAFLTMDKPSHISDLYSSQRWRKYWMNLWYPQYEPHRKRALDFMCRDAKAAGKSIERIYMLYWEEKTGAPGEVAKPLGCRILRAQRCAGRQLDLSAPLPHKLSKCDSYAWLHALTEAASEVCDCMPSDSSCMSRAWYPYRSAVERYIAQKDRGTAYPLSKYAEKLATSARKRIEGCLGTATEWRLH
ncbi:MAG: HTTM domain-containing protein [Myxococcota bacterium]|nr:HTTM domain-containing protein [Myxococcota bacterium]